MSSGVLSQIELFVFEKESLKILLQYKIYCIYIYIYKFCKRNRNEGNRFLQKSVCFIILRTPSIQNNVQKSCKVCMCADLLSWRPKTKPTFGSGWHTHTIWDNLQTEEWKNQEGKRPNCGDNNTTTEPLPDELHSQVWWTLLQPFYLEPSHLVFCAVIPQTD